MTLADLSLYSRSLFNLFISFWNQLEIHTYLLVFLKNSWEIGKVVLCYWVTFLKLGHITCRYGNISRDIIHCEIFRFFRSFKSNILLIIMKRGSVTSLLRTPTSLNIWLSVELEGLIIVLNHISVVIIDIWKKFCPLF